jgi:hypothetical protein
MKIKLKWQNFRTKDQIAEINEEYRVRVYYSHPSWCWVLERKTDSGIWVTWEDPLNYDFYHGFGVRWLTKWACSSWVNRNYEDIVK